MAGARADQKLQCPLAATLHPLPPRLRSRESYPSTALRSSRRKVRQLVVRPVDLSADEKRADTLRIVEKGGRVINPFSFSREQSLTTLANSVSSATAIPALVVSPARSTWIKTCNSSPAAFNAGTFQSLCERNRIERVDHIKEIDCPSNLVGLQVSDQVPASI